MKCKYGYTFDTLSNIVKQGINRATLREIRDLESSGVHLINGEGECITCELPRQLAIMDRPLKDFLEWAKTGETSSNWKDLNEFTQWIGAHLAHFQHVESTGEISLVWCDNCGPWVDDDASSDAESLRRAPIEDIILAVFRTQEPLRKVDKCIFCAEEKIEDQGQ